MKFFVSRCTIACAAGIVTAAALSARAGQDRPLPAPIFPTADPVINKIVVENEYGFSLRRYTPAVEFKPITRANAHYDTPEATTMALLSAMAAHDLDWFRSLWDAESARLMQARDTEKGQDAAFWIAAWDRTLKDRRVTIVNRVETGNYVIMVYALTPQSVATPRAEDSIELETPLKLIDGRWMATQELSSDPVLLYWKTPNTKVHRVVRGVHP